MNSRRRFILLFSAFALAKSISLRNLVPLVGLMSPYKAVSAVDPLTAINTAQTALSLIRSFSAQTDGGLSAYLQSIHQFQKISLDLLDEVVRGIGNLALQINDLRTEIPLLLDQSRLRAYLDDAISAQTQFRILRTSYDTAPKSQQKKFDQDFLAVEQQIVTARGRADSYYSFDASLAVPVCLSVEIAAKYQNGKSALIPETLRHYLNWLDGILDVKTPGSLANSLKGYADEFNLIAAGDRFKQQVTLGCLVPRVAVSYLPHPEENQFVFSSRVGLEPREMKVILASQPAGQSGAKELIAQTPTFIRSPGLPNCAAVDLDARFGISIEGKGTMVANTEEIENSQSIISDKKFSEFVENAKREHQAELDSLNRKALRIALLADALAATQEVRSSVVRTLRQLGEL